MKNTCTRCGSQLNVSERQCISCGAFNPFYIASFKSHQPVNAEIDALEQQLLATEVSEQSIATETGLKQELLRVKDETEQYKKQAIEMVNEVREELHHIDEENKRLKQEVEILSTNKAKQQILSTKIYPSSPNQKTQKRFLIATSVFVIGLCIGLGYFFITHKNDSHAIVATANPIQKPVQNTIVAGYVPPVTPVAHKEDAMPVKKMIALVTPPPAATKVVPVEPVVNKEDDKPAMPLITEDKVKVDILGNKLSGCGITVYNTSEIASLGNLVLVEKEPSGETKYKFAMRIVEKGEIYNATPYVYYDPNGVLVRVDGTNCE